MTIIVRTIAWLRIARDETMRVALFFIWHAFSIKAI